MEDVVVVVVYEMKHPKIHRTHRFVPEMEEICLSDITHHTHSDTPAKPKPNTYTVIQFRLELKTYSTLCIFLEKTHTYKKKIERR